MKKTIQEKARDIIQKYGDTEMGHYKVELLVNEEVAKAKEWISTKDRLPDDQRMVLVKTNKDSYSTAYCHGRNSGFIVYGEHAYTEFGEITHWREIK